MPGLELVAADLEQHLDGVNRAMSVDAYIRLWQATPVLTGYARSRWRLEWGPRIGGRISNDTDYLIYLNAGSSQQAPSGFIQRAVAQAIAVEHGPDNDRSRLRVRGYVSPDKDADPPDAVL